MQPYIAVEGVIGVGKTTLARLLAPVFNATAVLEEFEENPFLSSFYADKARYAFQTQIFFLLSRYRQQTARIPLARQQGPVISDYTFAKDSLFAHLTLFGDELAVYERVHEALAERIPKPDLLIYLRASHEVLMTRIAARDRPYERNMDPAYIEQLRIAYDDFIMANRSSSLLVLETDDIDYVKRNDDLEAIIAAIRGKLAERNGHTAADGQAAESPEHILTALAMQAGHLADFQAFHRSLDADKGFDPDPFFNFIMLTEEIGELARELKTVHRLQSQLSQQGHAAPLAAAINRQRERLQDELADCLAYLLKLSNYAGIDLEQAYLAKMAFNTQRDWDQEGEDT
ncbi:MAG: deoxynucleoside kinase [Anaerolineae bacterium]